MEYQFLAGYQNGIYASEEDALDDAVANDFRERFVSGMSLIVLVVAGILILWWIHRASYNARALGAQNMKFSPGWSVGYYFIPIPAWWKPYEAMKEIWKASQSPYDWESQDTNRILAVWWFLWVFTAFLGQAIFRAFMREDGLQGLINLNMFTQLSDAAGIPLAVVFLTIVNRVHGMQMSHLDTANR